MSGGGDPGLLWRVVTRDGRAGCWVCEHLPELGMHRVAHERERCEHVSGWVLDAHHLLAKQVLKRELLDPAAALVDPRNGIPVRRFHHDALEQRRIRIPRALLPAAAVDFAREHGLEALLDRYYHEEDVDEPVQP